MLLEVGEVGNLVDENVGTLSEGDQIVVDGGVAGEHNRAVGGIETVGQSGNRPSVGHRDARDPNGVVFEDNHRNLVDPLGPHRDRDVECPDKHARVGHTGVQRHDVEVVGVAGQKVLDQVRRAGVGQFGKDRRLSMEGGITTWTNSVVMLTSSSSVLFLVLLCCPACRTLAGTSRCEIHAVFQPAPHLNGPWTPAISMNLTPTSGFDGWSRRIQSTPRIT